MSELVLVLNAGSSSLKYSLVDAVTGEAAASGLVQRIGEPSGELTHSGPGGTHRTEQVFGTHEDAMRAVLEAFESHGPQLADAGLEAVGHRVVHGGARFSAPALVDDDLVSAVTELVPLAPLHNPANLEGIATARTLFPDLPQVAVFDTAFHATLPPHAYTYAVPLAWREEHHIRRYGFHGTSYSFVTEQAARFLGKAVEDVNLIVLHLGNGASATAIRGGRSVDTSMGMTPLEGLVMGTRSGDVDPALHGHLHRELGWSLTEVDRLLNRESGLKGLAGLVDFRELAQRQEAGDEAARLAFEVYCHRIRRYVGAFYAVLGTVDAVVFTAGVGENAAAVRAESLSGLERLGIVVDPALNDQRLDEPFAISPGTGPDDRTSERMGDRTSDPTGDRTGDSVAVLVVPTDEEWEIARQTMVVVRDVRG